MIEYPCPCEPVNSAIKKKVPSLCNDPHKDRETFAWLKELLGVGKVFNALIIPIVNHKQLCNGILILVNVNTSAAAKDTINTVQSGSREHIVF